MPERRPSAEKLAELRALAEAGFYAAARDDVLDLLDAVAGLQAELDGEREKRRQQQERAVTYLNMAKADEGEAAADRGERDAATALAARLAHVTHAVDVWAGVHVNDHMFTRDSRAEVRAVVAAARDEQQITDPYGRAVRLDHENAGLAEALRRIALRSTATDAEHLSSGMKRGAGWPGVCDECDSVEIADHALAELTPESDEPARADVRDLLAASSVGDPVSRRLLDRAPVSLAERVADAVGLHLPEPEEGQQ